MVWVVIVEITQGRRFQDAKKAPPEARPGLAVKIRLWPPQNEQKVQYVTP